ncbi:MAG: bifunctional 4-hydroxy-3-methylbut-2-enyl diphosphate reductase/30S ribosomal protein S1 [Clostridia bacterium]
MKITVAPSAGFCFGVSRAVDKVYELISTDKRKIYTLGPLIHNPQVIADLEKHGVSIISDVTEIPPDSLVVIRTHGVAKSVYNYFNENKINYFDATCPFVAKIQKIVSKYDNVVIAGDPCHPEVVGIYGHSNNCTVILNLENLKEVFEKKGYTSDFAFTLVAQTTFSLKEWKKISEYVKKSYTNAIIFDTICSATDLRQSDAEKIAKNSDVVLIIGGKSSSNTTKLYDICKEICPKSFHIENVLDIPIDEIKAAKNIGITAGASTSDDIIKEVTRKMTDLDNDFSFEEALENSLRPVNNGDIIKGIVVAVAPNEISLDLGTKQAGFITAAEYSADPNVKIMDEVHIGDEITVVAVRVNDVEGTILVSRKRITALEGLEDIEKAFTTGESLDGFVSSVVNSGVIVDHRGARVFIPASQSGVSRDGDLNSILKKDVVFKVIDIKDGRRKRYIGSIKRASKDKILNDIEVGATFKGIVKSFTNYGAFIDIGGMDGMIHISELSWSRIKHPSDVLTLNQEIEVYVKDYNPETRRISLGFKKPSDNPFTLFLSKFNVGDIIDVKIARIFPFGAFAEIIPNVDGLIHISQIANVRVNKIQEFFKVGDTVSVKITDIDEANQKISLSRKVLLDDYVEPTENPSVEEVSETPATEDTATTEIAE